MEYNNSHKNLVNAMGKTYDNLWRHTIREDASSAKVNSFDDYMGLCEKHDNLRRANAPYKSTVHQYAGHKAEHKGNGYNVSKTIKKRTDHLNQFSSIHHGLVEQLRHKSFKKVLDIQKPDKSIKKSIIQHSRGLADKYDQLAEVLKSQHAERRTALKGLKHLNLRLDPRSNMSTATAHSWLIARNKPGGDKSLRLTMQHLGKSRENAHREAYSALARSSSNNKH